MWWKLSAIAIVAALLIAFWFLPIPTHAVAYGPLTDATLPTIQSQIEHDQRSLRLMLYAGWADFAALLILGWLAWRVVRK